MNLLQRTLAIASATGTAALMSLPAFAQSGVVNNGDINRMNNPMMNNSTTQSQQCAPYTSGGVGGPTGQASSDDTAAAGIPGSTNSNVNQFPSPASIAQPQPINQNVVGSTNAGTTGYNSGSQSAMAPMRQFDGNNRSAAIAYRQNGPAGTAGHEVKMNLNAFQERRNSMPMAYNSLSAPQASATLPVACAPR